MKLLVTGANGQLGYDVVKELNKRNMDCVPAGREDFDITDESATINYISARRPDVVIHCAAYTAVDKAEDEIELCKSVNVKGTCNVAMACKLINAKMVYISTDYVFSGKGDKFYETNDEAEPLNVYGKTKLDGENFVREILDNYFIIRTSWVFGINGNNFIKTILKLLETQSVLNVVSDQVGSPTYTADLAVLICDMVTTNKYGIYHATNEGICSWAELAQEVIQIAGYNTKVNCITSEEYRSRAIRPKNSRLSKKSLDDAGFYRLPGWQDALRRYIKELSI